MAGGSKPQWVNTPCKQSLNVEFIKRMLLREVEGRGEGGMRKTEKERERVKERGGLFAYLEEL